MNYSRKNPAVKRILQEIRELQSENSPEFQAEAIEENIFEWHFAIRGPPDTEFEGGIYHGRILLPSEYPFKPPEFIMLSKNGRWETQTKICLSISSHHPEHWQPSWSVRTALMALIAFMPTPANGAIGSLDYPKNERQRLAALSRTEPPNFGSASRHAITLAVHQKLLNANPLAAKSPRTTPEDLPSPVEEEIPEQRRQILQAIEARRNAAVLPLESTAKIPEGPSLEEPEEANVNQKPLVQNESGLQNSNRQPPPRQLQNTHTSSIPTSAQISSHETELTSRSNETNLNSSWEERGLNFLAVALFVAILAVLGRRAFAGTEIADFS